MPSIFDSLPDAKPKSIFDDLPDKPTLAQELRRPIPEDITQPRPVMPSLEGTPEFLRTPGNIPENLFAPGATPETVKVPTLTDPTARAGQAILNIGGEAPEITPLEESYVKLPRWQVNKDDSAALAAGKEVLSQIEGLPEFFASDAGILTLLSSLNPIGKVATTAFFTKQMIESFGEQVKQSEEDWDTLTSAEKSQRVVQMAATGLLGTMLAKSTAHGVVRGTPLAEKIRVKGYNPDFRIGKESMRPGRDLLWASTEEMAGKDVGQMMEKSLKKIPEMLPAPFIEAGMQAAKRPEAERSMGFRMPPLDQPFATPEIQDLAGRALEEQQRMVQPATAPAEVPALEQLREAIEGPQPSPILPGGEPTALAEPRQIPGGGEAPYGQVSYQRPGGAPVPDKTAAALRAGPLPPEAPLPAGVSGTTGTAEAARTQAALPAKTGLPGYVEGLTGDLRARLTTPVNEENVGTLSESEAKNVRHSDGMIYGADLGLDAVPRLEDAYKQASADMKDAFARGDRKGQLNAFARLTFYGGALQGVTRGEHPAAAGNWAAFVKDREAKGLPVPGEDSGVRGGVSTRFSYNPGTTVESKVGEINRVIDSEFSDAKGGVNVVSGFDALPDRTKAEVRATFSNPNSLPAFYDVRTKQVIFNAEHPIFDSGDPQVVRDMMVHEVAIHKGLRVALGSERFNTLMDQAWRAMKPEETAQLIKQGYQKSGRILGEEWLAHKAEAVIRSGVSDTIWSKVADTIRRIARDKFNINMRFSDTEIARMVKQGFDAVKAEGSKVTEVKLDPKLVERLKNYAQGAPVDVGDGFRAMLTDNEQKRLQKKIANGDPNSKLFADALDWQKKITDNKMFWELNPEKSWIEDNDEYWKSVDPDLLCQRSEGTDAAVNYLKQKLGDKYESTLGWEIIARAQAKGLRTPCPQCYVFSHRAANDLIQKKYVIGVGGYNGEILRFKDAVMQELANRPLRHYSSTDFKAEHIPGLMVEFADAESRGIPVSGYSKQGDLARIFGKAGMYLNLSIGMDEFIGMNQAEAFKLRKENPNVATVYVSFTDADTLAALRNPQVDHVIPWHASAQKVTQLKASLAQLRTKLKGEEIKDYTREQYDTVGGKKAERQIKEWEHNGDLKTYLRLLEENGLTKRFPGIFDQLSAKEKPLYMKLIGREYGKFGDTKPYQAPKSELIDQSAIPAALEGRLATRMASAKEFVDIAKGIEKEIGDGTFVKSAGPPEIKSGPIKQGKQVFRKTKADLQAEQGEGGIRGAIRSKSEEMMSAEALKSANRSARSAGAVGSKAMTPRYVAETGREGDNVLNFGSGVPNKETGRINHSDMLESMGMRVTNHDIGDNAKYADPEALTRKYDTVFASNVLNKLPTPEVAEQVMREIRDTVDPAGGRAVFNLPNNPRDLPMTPLQIRDLAKRYFRDVRVVRGALWKDATPLFEARGPIAEGEGGIRGAIRPPVQGLEDIYKIFEATPAPKVPPGTRLINFVESLRTGLSSKYRPLNRLAEDIAKAYGLTSRRDIAGIMEQLKGSQGRGEAQVYRFNNDVAKLVRGEERDFNIYMFLRRTLDRLEQDQKDIAAALAGQNVPTLNRRSVGKYTIPEIQQKLQTLQNSIPADVLNRFKTAADKYQDYMDEALRLQVESGRMTMEIYNAIKQGNQFYAPFKVMKYIEETMRPEGTGAKIDTLADFTKAMKGIEDTDHLKLGDMLAAGRQNILLSRILADKAVAVRHLTDLTRTDTSGLFIRQLAPNVEPPSGWEIVHGWDNGKKTRYATRPDVANALAAAGPAGKGLLASMLRGTSMVFKAGATALNIPFQVSNLLADVPRAALVSKYGIKSMADLVNYPMDMVASIYSAMTGNFGLRNKLYMDFLESGTAGTTIQEYLTPEALRFRDPSTMSNAKRLALGVLYSPAEFSTAIEQISKILGVRRAMREHGVTSGLELAKQIPEAVTEIRRFSGSPDFGRQGLWTEKASLNVLYMFFNARLQGTIADLGRLTGRDGGKTAAVTWGRLAAAVGLPTAYLYYVNHHSPEAEADYNQRTANEKANYWLIPKSTYITLEDGSKVRDFWRIPKRESSKWIANLIESSLDFARKQDPQSFAKLGQNMMEDIVPVNITGSTFQERIESTGASLHPFIKGPIQAATGRDLYRHMDIVPDVMRKGDPELQYKERTPELFKKLANAMPDIAPEIMRSPLRIEDFTRNMTAGLITQFLSGKPVEGRNWFENSALMQRFQATPYTDNEQFTKDLKEMERESTNEFLTRTREAKRLISENPDATVGELFQMSQKPGEKPNLKMFHTLMDMWIGKQSGITPNEKRIAALPAEQRAKYLLRQFSTMDPEQKQKAIQDLSRKRVLTTDVLIEMAKQSGK